MLKHRAILTACSLIAFVATVLIGRLALTEPTGNKENQRVFEIRTYTTEPGKLPALLARFRDHTTKLFEKHGMTNIGYWTPTDEPRSKNTLIYILAHDSRDAAKKSWAEFRADPDWQKVQKQSEAAGKIVTKTESVFADATDFSAIK